VHGGPLSSVSAPDLAAAVAIEAIRAFTTPACARPATVTSDMSCATFSLLW